MKIFIIILLGFSQQYCYSQDTIKLSNVSFQGKEKLALLISGSIENNTKSNDNIVGTGSLGVSYQKGNNSEILALISVSETSSSITNSEETFGTSILIPGSGSGSISFDFKKFNHAYKRNYEYTPFERFGINFNIRASLSTFEFDGQREKGLIIAPSFNLLYKIFEKSVVTNVTEQGTEQQEGTGNDILIYANLGLTTRFIGGEIDQAEEFRKLLFGTLSEVFYGIQTGVTIRVNNFNAYFNIPILKADTGDKVKGLTGTNAIIGIEFRGDIWRIGTF